MNVDVPGSHGLRIDALRVDETLSPRLTIGGTLALSDVQPPHDPTQLTAHLVGPRQELLGVFRTMGNRWEATFSLLQSRWGSASLPVPSGEYQLLFNASGHSLPLELAASLPDRVLVGGLLGVEFVTAVDSETGVHELTMVISPPLRAA